MTPTRVIAVVLLASTAALAAEPATLSLAEARAVLEQKNLTLAQARARAAEAQGVVRQALAPLLPTLAAQGSYVRNNAEARLSINALLDSIEGGLARIAPMPVRLDRTNVPNDALIQPLQAVSVSGVLRVPLFAANGYADYQGAREAGRAAELSVEGARLQLLAALEQAAAWAQAAEEISQASQKALTVAQEFELSAKRRVQAGTQAPLTALQAATEAVRRQSEVVRAAAELEKARLAIGVLLGRAEPVRVTLPGPRPGDAPLDEAVSLALVQRPELMAQGAAIEAARQQVSSAWWRLLPTLSASGSAVASDVPFVTGLYYGWRVSLDLSWTLYDGGFRYGKRAQAEAQLAAAQAQREAQSLEVRQQVLDARRDAEVARERLGLAGQQARLAEEAAATARRSFEVGLASSLDVLDANDRQYQAEVALADARSRVTVAGVALARATGALLER